jgi:hypothetical protein
VTRGITSPMLAELQGSAIRPVLFFEVEFEASTYRFCSTDFDIVWGGYTWLGNGIFQRMPRILDSLDSGSSGVSIELSGVGSSLLEQVLSSLSHKHRGKLYLSLLNNVTNVLTYTPISLFEGYMETATIVDTGDDCKVEIEYESAVARFDKAKEIRMTHEAQVARFPGDRGFSYVAGLAKWSGFWGKSEKVKISAEMAKFVRKWKKNIKQKQPKKKNKKGGHK